MKKIVVKYELLPLILVMRFLGFCFLIIGIILVIMVGIKSFADPQANSFAMLIGMSPTFLWIMFSCYLIRKTSKQKDILTSSSLSTYEEEENQKTQKTSLGLNEDIESLLCYVLLWITGIIFLLIEKKSKFVRFHALRSTMVFGGFTVILFIIGGTLKRALFVIAIIFWAVYIIDCFLPKIEIKH